MPEEKCFHSWEMFNIIPGFIITEKCFNNKKISTYFSTDSAPPFEEYREGDDFWNVVECAQSIQFGLKCTKCGTIESFDELSGLMMCTGCDEICEVNTLLKKLEPKRIWIYVAFGFLPLKIRKQLSPDKIEILEEYFNQRRKSEKSKIRIVSHEMVKDIATCYPEVIKDIAMLDLRVQEGQ